MKFNEFDQNRWKNDLLAFHRWQKFYEKVSSPKVKKNIIGYLKSLQEKWPNHKLGDIPGDETEV